MTPEERRDNARRGRSLLRDVATPLGLWEAFRAGVAPDPARRSVVLRLIESTRMALDAHATAFAARFARGLGGIRIWGRDFLSAIGAGHFAAAMAAVGSHRPSDEELDVAARRVDREAKFFARFRADLRRPDGMAILQPIRAGVATARKASAEFVARARMYADALFGTGEEVFRERMRRAGLDQVLWVLSGGVERHCGGCPAQAARGWVPIDDSPPHGSQPCRSRCRCYRLFRKAGADLLVPSPFAIS